MKALHVITFILVIIGALNWLLVAFNWNVVAMLGPSIAMVVYVLVGLSAIYQIFTHKSYCKNCMGMGTSQTM